MAVGAVDVSADNLQQYVDGVADHVIGKGVMMQIEAFTAGFDEVCERGRGRERERAGEREFVRVCVLGVVCVRGGGRGKIFTCVCVAIHSPHFATLMARRAFRSLSTSISLPQVFPMKHLRVFTAEELELHIRGDIEAWDLDTLRAR